VESQLSRARLPASNDGAIQSRNHFLAHVSQSDLEAMEPHLLKASLSVGQIVVEAGEPVEMVYFPSTAVLSMVTVMQDGRSVEGMTIGQEGMVGAIGALACAPAHAQTICQIPGHSYRMAASVFRHECNKRPSLHHLTLRFIDRDLAQLQQSVACNASHTVNQRLARWLLVYQDRVAGPSIGVTQGGLSAMLGVQRTTVTLAPGSSRWQA
jgi:CRP-like cAMP-binding protein